MFKIFCKYSTFLEIRREIFDIFYTHTLFSPLWHEKIPLCFLALSEAFGVISATGHESAMLVHARDT